MGILARLGVWLAETLLPIFIKEIAADLKAWWADRQARKQLEQDLNKAGEHAKETKDTSQAEDILRGNAPKP
jgi:hypothetical protein